MHNFPTFDMLLTRFGKHVGKLGMAILISLMVALPNLTHADEGNLSLMQSSDRVRGYLWNDMDCDGLRQNTEGAMATAQQMSLFYIGNDSIPFTRDDNEVGLGGAASSLPIYLFDSGGGGNTYYIAIRPADRPIGFVPGPWQQGVDTTIDNDMKLWPDGTWATGTFTIAAQTVTGIDIGLCPVASVPMPYHIHLPLAVR